MNLLFLTPQLPFPPRQGTAIRNWGLIRHLAARHAITLLSFAEPGQTADGPELKAACRQVVTVPLPRRSRGDRLHTLFSPHPDLARRLSSPEFEAALTRLLRDSAFDVVHLEGLEMAPYLPLLRNAQPRARLIYDAHNAEHVIQRRAFATDLRQPARWPAALYSWLQIPRLGRFEAEVCRSVDGVVCVSETDAAALRWLVPSQALVIVPNGIDVEDYLAYPARSMPPAVSPPSPRPRLVFTGKMDYRPNVDAVLWFAAEVLPRIRAVRPEVQFVVVGQRPTEKVNRLMAHPGRGILVTGAVEDTRPFIAGATVYVAPLRMGGGTRFKLLEAMALACPIVSTTIGAEGFTARPGQARHSSAAPVLLADSPADFAAAVLALLADPERAAALGQAGRAFVLAGYDWSAIIPKLEAVYLAPRPQSGNASPQDRAKATPEGGAS